MHSGVIHCLQRGAGDLVSDLYHRAGLAVSGLESKKGCRE
jgi:hypothetical protein